MSDANVARRELEVNPNWARKHPEYFLKALHKFHSETIGWNKSVEELGYATIFVAENPNAN